MRPNIGIIPCKLESKRLKRKNLQKIGDKTLLDIAIEYLQTSSLLSKIEVYTTDLDDPEIIAAKKRYKDVQFRPQPKPIREFLTDLFIDIYKNFYSAPGQEIGYFVTTTCDNPIKPPNLDEHIQFAKQRNLMEYVTFDHSYNKVGALHIISQYALQNKRLSGYLGYTTVDGIDIHTQGDLDNATALIQTR